MKISKHQYLELVGLITLANKHISFLDDLQDAAEKITQENGHTNDMIWGHRNLDEGLEILGIEVEE